MGNPTRGPSYKEFVLDRPHQVKRIGLQLRSQSLPKKKHRTSEGETWNEGWQLYPQNQQFAAGSYYSGDDPQSSRSTGITLVPETRREQNRATASFFRPHDAPSLGKRVLHYQAEERGWTGQGQDNRRCHVQRSVNWSRAWSGRRPGIDADGRMARQ